MVYGYTIKVKKKKKELVNQSISQPVNEKEVMGNQSDKVCLLNLVHFETGRQWHINNITDQSYFSNCHIIRKAFTYL